MKELAVQHLAEKFKRYQFKYTNKFRNLSPAHNKFFEEAVELFNRCPQIDQDLYVEAQFYFAHKFNRQCSPSWLVTEKAITRYTEFLEGRDVDVSKEKDPQFKDIILDSLKSSILFMNKKMVELGIPSYKDVLMFNDQPSGIPRSYTWIVTKQITKPFLAVIKSYPEYYDSLDADVKRDVPSPESLESLRTYIKIGKKLRTFCVSILGAECNIS
jgi:hypothetical protein